MEAAILGKRQVRKSFRIRSYEKVRCKSFRFRSYKNTRGVGGIVRSALDKSPVASHKSRFFMILHTLLRSWRSFPQSIALFSIACELFSENTRVRGTFGRVSSPSLCELRTPCPLWRNPAFIEPQAWPRREPRETRHTPAQPCNSP